MLNSRTFDDIAARIGQMIENSPAKDIEKNVKAMLASGLSRLDVVPRAEFDVQAQVLLRTREKLEALEQRLTELEARLGISPSGIRAQGAAAAPTEGPEAFDRPVDMVESATGDGPATSPSNPGAAPRAPGPAASPGAPPEPAR